MSSSEYLSKINSSNRSTSSPASSLLVRITEELGKISIEPITRAGPRLASILVRCPFCALVVTCRLSHGQYESQEYVSHLWAEHESERQTLLESARAEYTKSLVETFNPHAGLSSTPGTQFQAGSTSRLPDRTSGTSDSPGTPANASPAKTKYPGHGKTAYKPEYPFSKNVSKKPNTFVYGSGYPSCSCPSCSR